MSFLPTHLPILMYHQVLPKTHPDFKKHIAVDPEVFRGQVKQLLEQGWKFMTVDEYFSHPEDKRPAKTAILTFDDLASSFVEYGLPVCNELNVRASLFPIQNMTFNRPYHNLSKDGISPLNDSDIKMLSDAGFEIGSHGQSHQNFRKISLTQVREEMGESKKWLEGVIGKKVNTICYPIGGVDRDIVDTAKDLGYINGLSTLKGSLQFSGDRMSLRRVDIKNHVVGDKLKFGVSPFYGFRRFITRPFRAKYRVDARHPSIGK